MNKTIFKINKMDCASEVQLIRMKLEGLENIQSLDFDVPKRELVVIHSDSYERIFSLLDALNFETSVQSSGGIEGFVSENDPHKERKLLWTVLAINFTFFILEMLTGWLSHSMGLVADSLDMLADAAVYALALFAVGGTMARKRSIAKASGYFQIALAVLGFAEIIRRFLGFGDVPNFQTMIVVSALALIGNSICLYLLQKSKSKEAHMEASMIFTSNDVIINAGVIAAGILVFITESKLPDLIVGLIVFVIVVRGAVRILKL